MPAWQAGEVGCMSVLFLPKNDAIDVWKVDLDDDAWDASCSILSSDEWLRGASFLCDRARLHFRRCRTALRILLGQYLDQEPSSIELILARFGKPSLAGQQFHFNLSHSDGTALIAVAHQPVGIDLQRHGGVERDVASLAELVLHPAERAIFDTLPVDEARMLFYRTWAKKEAYAKYLGTGLQQSFTDLRFDQLPHCGAQRVVNDNANGAAPAFIHDLPDDKRYVASICFPALGSKVGLPRDWRDKHP